jgi:large subunit ribosomal protein L25
MADRPSLAVQERPERGSRSNRRLRREGLVPGVIYGGGENQNFAFKVDALSLRKLLADGAALLDLEIDGGRTRPVIVKDQQNHPVRDEIVHIDFLEVRLDEKIQTTVPVELEGGEESPGVKEGGVLEHVTRELNVEALPTDIPDNIVVDVSEMEIAATLPLSEVPAPQGVTFLDETEETVIATLVPPTEVEEPEEIEEETALVGEDGEPVEAAEGEEAPEGGGEEPGADSEGDSGS